MAKSRKTSNKKGAKKSPKKVANKQSARNRMLWSLGLALLFFFAMTRLGAFGVTAYNLVRLFVGSLAYPSMILCLAYLFGFRFFQKRPGLLGGLMVTLLGLLIEWHAYLFSLPGHRDKAVVSHTMTLIAEELFGLRISQFLGGGLFGSLIYQPVAFLFSNLGSYLIGALFILLGLFLISPWDLEDVAEFFKVKGQELSSKHELRKQERFLAREEKRLALEEERLEAEQRAQEEREEREAKLLAEEERLNQLRIDMETGEILEDTVYQDESYEASQPAYEPEIIAYEPEVQAYDQFEAYDEQAGFEAGASFEEPAWPEEEPVYDLDSFEGQSADFDQELSEDFAPAFDKQAVAKALLSYKLPSIDLFAPDKPKNQSKEKSLVRKNIQILEDTFKSFGIDVKVERAEIGPSVTKYEIKPAVGVRVNRISNLADDLALALAAKDVRIEAPIPGKSLVGIEVPNSEIATVSFRELWEQSQTDPKNLLEIPLGKAVNGSAKSFDLAKMPHLLVAGSTGSGKSVAVNGIISSILMKARPDEVKFMMIDPKMVELSVYNDIPHLLIPVVTNPRKASKALQKVVAEMENRYELFSHFGVRNIAGYNAKVEEFNSQSQDKQVPLPLMVVIVDELADLMMVASKEVEDAIIRLGQKARAAGIHMILATQRPSVDVISGLIKANVPSRVAFAVASGTDSRTILGENGAEKLLGRGDMLFHPIGEAAPLRLQGSFISDDDVERIVSFVKAQAQADYDDSFDPGEVSENDTAMGGSGGASEGDPLFEEAKALVLETQKASASMIQRRLSVGFNRATRLMEELEEAGVIGPAEGTKPRKVLMK